MSGAGSGEVRLEFLDDVDRDSVKSDGKALVYDSSDGKWKGESILTGAADELSAGDAAVRIDSPFHLPSLESYTSALPSDFTLSLSTSSKNSRRTSPLPAPDIFWFAMSLCIRFLKLLKFSTINTTLRVKSFSSL
jgi:hypothetical protein